MQFSDGGTKAGMLAAEEDFVHGTALSPAEIGALAMREANGAAEREHPHPQPSRIASYGGKYLLAYAESFDLLARVTGRGKPDVAAVAGLVQAGTALTEYENPPHYEVVERKRGRGKKLVLQPVSSR